MNPFPKQRLVDALTGEHVSTTFFGALSEADAFCAELDGLRELQCRVQELEAERDDLRRDLVAIGVENDKLAGKLRLAQADADDAAHVIGQLIAVRDQLELDVAERLQRNHALVMQIAELKQELAKAKQHNNNEGKQ